MTTSWPEPELSDPSCHPHSDSVPLGMTRQKLPFPTPHNPAQLAPVGRGQGTAPSSWARGAGSSPGILPLPTLLPMATQL